MRKNFIKDIRGVVIKVGTSVLTRGGRFDKTIIGDLAAEIAGFLKRGTRVWVVTSGAIGAGMTLLNLKKRPVSMQGLQAAAAVGQRHLMQGYEEAFARRGFSTAQVLLTWDDLASPKRFLNAKRTLKQIQDWGRVPVINENDTVATDEIRFGDNDRLSSLLSILVEADALVILSDTNGLCRGGRHGARIPVVEKTDGEIFSHAKENKNDFTVGGMASKLKAIRMSVSSGIPVFLAGGRSPKVLTRIFAGEDIGTFFAPHLKKRSARKDWVTHFTAHIRAQERL
ncbi:MAG: glutamate 5-kinase [Candidatus Omnitrophica bacterium]|nr:glutamate 5-kinase [Candidatus Omnitrophota bacterium]